MKYLGSELGVAAYSDTLAPFCFRNQTPSDINRDDIQEIIRFGKWLFSRRLMDIYASGPRQTRLKRHRQDTLGVYSMAFMLALPSSVVGLIGQCLYYQYPYPKPRDEFFATL
ncbi:MAG: hypothetical protein U0936_03280 [Planctomycetaceae bacterium]